MKKILLIITSLFCIIKLQSQIDSTIQFQDYKKHIGFYLSMGFGPVFGTIKDDIKNMYVMDIKGTGVIFDLKIGGTISENFILHATLLSNTLPNPTISVSPIGSGKSSNDLAVGEAMIGGGFTYYMMPFNGFISLSAGLGNFTIIDDETSISTQRGFSMQLKAGKEWWLSNRWGMGIAFGYGKTSLVNKPDNSTEEKLNSNRYSIMLNITLN